MKKLALVALLVLTACGPVRKQDAAWRWLMEERRSELPTTPVAPVPKTDPPAMKDVSYRGDICWLPSPSRDSKSIGWVACHYEEPYGKGTMPGMKYVPDHNPTG
jgi:hypothetical protein